MKINETLNFMGEDFCNNLKNTFTSNIFPWYYNNHVAGEGNDGTEFFFTHILFSHIEKKVNSERAFELIRPLLDKLNLSIEKLKSLEKRPELATNEQGTRVQGSSGINYNILVSSKCIIRSCFCYVGINKH